MACPLGVVLGRRKQTLGPVAFWLVQGKVPRIRPGSTQDPPRNGEKDNISPEASVVAKLSSIPNIHSVLKPSHETGGGGLDRRGPVHAGPDVMPLLAVKPSRWLEWSERQRVP